MNSASLKLNNLPDVFQQLEEEQKQVEVQLEQFEEAVKTLAQSNGSGEGVRKKLRSKLKKAGFAKACESLVKR